MLGELLRDMKKAASGDSRVPGALLKMIKVDIVSFLQEAPQRHTQKKKKDFYFIHTSTLTLLK